jgi:hypothetical protein
MPIMGGLGMGFATMQIDDFGRLSVLKSSFISSMS